MTESLNNGFDKLKETFQSDQFKKILPYLIAGGAGATAGAYATGKRKSRQKESRLGYLGRVLRNALTTGGLAAGAVGLARYGADKLKSPETINGMQPAGVENPTDQALRAALFSPVSALGAGATGLLATSKLPIIGADFATRDKVLNQIASNLSTGGKTISSEDVLRMSRFDPVGLRKMMESIQNSSGGSGPFVGGIDQVAREAGLTLGKDLPKGPTTNLRLRETLAKMIRNPGDIKNEMDAMKDRLRYSPVGEAAANIKKNPKDIIGELKILKDMEGPKYRAEQIRQLGSKFKRRGLSTLGQTGGRRAFRGGLGLAAAAIPALIGAFATDEKSQNQ